MEEGPHTPHRIMHPHRHVITIKNRTPVINVGK
jgi:hypothetical protein